MSTKCYLQNWTFKGFASGQLALFTPMRQDHSMKHNNKKKMKEEKCFLETDVGTCCHSMRNRQDHAKILQKSLLGGKNLLPMDWRLPCGLTYERMEEQTFVHLSVPE